MAKQPESDSKTPTEPTKPAFEPPEVSADEIIMPEEKERTAADDVPPTNKHPKKTKGRSRLKHLVSRLKGLNKKQWLTAIATFLILAGSGSSIWSLQNRQPVDDGWVPDVPKYVKPEPEKPKTVASRLTGVQVKPELNELPTTAVMIENSPDARPQSGLMEAGVVFEAIAEGGITRFNAIYLESQPDKIGPVRSVRPYFIDFFAPFDAPIAHVGGSAQALAEIRQQGLKDLDQFHNPGAYQRVNYRYAPHNMYTSRAQLLAVQQSKGWTSSTFNGFTRKTEKPAEAPNARAIDLDISGFLYNPHFDYVPATNSYNRSMAGKPHTDEPTGKVLSPKVVIALVSPHHYAGIYSVYQTTGSGKAYIFQDGTVTEGIWEKEGRQAQFRFGDANGSPIGLNPGQTWITLVSSADRVKITP